MLQETLDILRQQFLSLNRGLSTVIELVNNGLMFDDETALLNYAGKLIVNKHNFQFCTIHVVKDNELILSCATSTDEILDPSKIDGKEQNWVRTCEHLAKQLLDRKDNEIMKRQAGGTSYFSMPIVYRDDVLAILTLNAPGNDDNHPKLISIFCNTLTSVLINTRNSQFLTQEVARRTEELESAVKLADASSKAKTQFLTNMSHEYLTPLNAISGMSSLLIETDLDLEQRDHIETIIDSSDQLHSLVQNLLVYTRSAEGDVKITSKVTNLFELLQGTYDTFISSAHAKGLELELLIPSDLPRLVKTDGHQLEQMFAVLITNAIKFTPSGRVTIDAYCEKPNEDQVLIKFSIFDTGIGIKEEDLKDIFKVLHQLDNSDSREYQGAGLGLAICNKIAKLFESEIHVKSVPNQGSEFSFSINFDVVSVEENEWEGVEAEQKSLSLALKTKQVSRGLQSQMSVLLVEDNLINQKLAARLLEKMGCYVDIANDGVDAVDKFSKTPYDLIFMDCQMPNMDGFEATSRIREMELTNSQSKDRTPIIALTANSLPEDRARSYDAGMDEFLTKPILKEKLHSALMKWISPQS